MPSIRSFSVPHVLRSAGLAVALELAGGSGAAGAFEDDYLDTVAGPVSARIVKVRDGDTAEVVAYVWPGQTVHVAVRLHGIDAPEHRGKCDSEKAAADAAQDRFTEIVAAAGNVVTLTAISGDKYFGRVLADMQAGGQDVARQLLTEGHVAPYDGKARRSWCDAGATASIGPPREPAPVPPRPAPRPAPGGERGNDGGSGGLPGFPGYRGPARAGG